MKALVRKESNPKSHGSLETQYAASVIIVTYRRPHSLNQLLESLTKQNDPPLPLQIIIADGDERREASNIAANFSFKDWTLEYLPLSSRGKTELLNAAVKHAESEWIFIFDDDVTLNANVMKSYFEAARRWPNAVYFGGPVETICEDQIPNFISTQGRHRLYLAWPHHNLGEAERFYQKNEGPMGANRLIRKKLFDQGVRFDTRFISYGLVVSPADDMGFGEMLHTRGEKMVYVPEAKVLHHIQPDVFELKNLWHRYLSFGRYQFLAEMTEHDPRQAQKKFSYAFRALILHLLNMLRYQRQREVAFHYHCAETARHWGIVREWSLSLLRREPYETTRMTETKSINPNCLDEAWNYLNEGSIKPSVYVKRNLKRLLLTISWLPNKPLKILDLGSDRHFALLLSRYRPHYEIHCGGLKIPRGAPRNASQVDELNEDRRTCLSSSFFNVESDSFPYESESFDMVLSLELIEHLLFDPMNMIKEINRVLKTGGQLLLTTPNIMSWRSILNAIAGIYPMEFIRYFKKPGFTQHVREYSPWEIQQLLEEAGFKIKRLKTYEVTQSRRLNFLEKISSLFLSFLIPLMGRHPKFLFHRNPKIFALAIKNDLCPENAGSFLYDVDFWNADLT